MIPGVVATSVFPPSGFAPPADAVVYLDFMDEQYWINGTETALGSLFDRTDFVVPGSGALFDWNTADLPAVMSSTIITAINDIGGSFTVVCEWKRLESGYSDIPLALTGDTSSSYIYFEQNYTGSTGVFGSAKLNSTWHYLSITPPPGIGNVARAVLSYDQASGVAFAVNGTFAGSDAGSAPTPPTFGSGALGGDAADTFLLTNSYIRKVEIYPLKTDSEITTLSAL